MTRLKVIPLPKTLTELKSGPHYLYGKTLKIIFDAIREQSQVSTEFHDDWLYRVDQDGITVVE